MVVRIFLLLFATVSTLFLFQNCSTPSANQSLSYGSKTPDTSGTATTTGVFGSGGTPVDFQPDGVRGCSLVIDKPNGRYLSVDPTTGTANTITAMVSCNFNLSDSSKNYKLKWYEQSKDGKYYEVTNNEFWGGSDGKSPGVWSMAIKDLEIGTHNRFVLVCDGNTNSCFVQTTVVSFTVLPTCQMMKSAIIDGATNYTFSKIFAQTTPLITYYIEIIIPQATLTSANMTAAQYVADKGMTPKNWQSYIHYAGQAGALFAAGDAVNIATTTLPGPGFQFGTGKANLTAGQTFYIKGQLYDAYNNLICQTTEISFEIK